MSDWKTLADTLGLTLRPVDVWPKKLRNSWEREKSPFTAPLKDTLRVLKYELECLRATDVVLQIAIREQDLRQDGLPRAGAVASHPGVILSFHTQDGPRRRAFDRFTRWEHNLRALASNLYDLRHANLYGVEEDNEQYRGWKALPAPDDGALSTREEAALLIARLSGVGPAMAPEIAEDPEKAAYYYRLAAKLAHPDRGGDHETFVKLQAAKALLDQQGSDE